MADSFDRESLRGMCAQTKVVLTTVGPYLSFGEPLVEACIEEKTNYVDLTGEVPFIHNMIEKYHEKAILNKIKIVHCTGFDSIPSDIGNLVLQSEYKKKLGNTLMK